MNTESKMQTQVNELTHKEQFEVQGGGPIGDFFKRVDNVIDTADDYENNGSCRPFKAFESL